MTLRQILPQTALPATFKDAMRHLVGGVSVITAGAGEARTGLTVTSAISLSLDPPTMLVCVNRNASAWPVTSASGTIASTFWMRAISTSRIDSWGAAGSRAAPATTAPDGGARRIKFALASGLSLRRRMAPRRRPPRLSVAATPTNRGNPPKGPQETQNNPTRSATAALAPNTELIRSSPTHQNQPAV
jgi:hypothetical protein